MNQDQAENIALDILEKGRYLAKDRFPKPDTKTVQAWGEVVFRYGLPGWLWLEAVTVFCTEMVSSRMVTPLDIVEAARVAKSRWERSSEGRAALAKTRGDVGEIDPYHRENSGQRGETAREYQQRVHPKVAKMIAEMVERRESTPPDVAQPGQWWCPKDL